MAARRAQHAPDTGQVSISTSKVIAGCFSLAAFGVALVAGLASDNPVAVILLRALISMVLSYPVGWIIGMICQRVIEDHVRVHVLEHPAPDAADDQTAAESPTREANEEIISV